MVRDCNMTCIIVCVLYCNCTNFDGRKFIMSEIKFTGEYPKVSGLAPWSENCKWYSSLPLGAVVSLFCESF